MPLEAVMIAIDNSEWTRNGDYAPTRFSAQNEAVGYLANAKLQENQESSVGLMTMAGNRIEVLISPGREPGQLLNALARVPIGGQSNVIGALKTAQLALKNRQNKNQRQRVILFVGSPLEAEVAELVKLGKLLKKNNVAVDVINFGTENTTNDNTEKLEQLIAAVNTADNSHLVSIPPGPHIFADLVLTSAIMQSGGGGAGIAGVPSGAGGAGAGGASVGGIDPNMDPEMAMAIRMSMEEERQRQQKAAGGDAAQATAGGTASGAPAAAAAPMEDDEDALLAQAIALSMQENNDAPMADAGAAAPATPAAAAPAAPAPATPAAAAPAAGDVASAADIDLAMQDPDFLNSLLAGVPGAEGQSVDNLLDELQGAGAAGSAGASGSSDVGAKPAEKKEEPKK